MTPHSGGSLSIFCLETALIAWENSLAEIRSRIFGVGGYGWKGKLVIGWALEREVLDGLEITDRQGKKYVLTAIKGRDELFNRLIAMGRHKWESW